MEIPDFITHYNRSEPFRSISSVSPEKLPAVLKELNETTAWGIARFSDSEYLKRRVIVEKKIRQGFIEKGGNPVLAHPIYFFLGKNDLFEEHKRNKPYLIELRDLPKHTVSFTYGDSMFCFNEDYRRLKGKDYLSELCTQTYTYEELPRIFSHTDYSSETHLHIEAQLWITPADAMLSGLVGEEFEILHRIDAHIFEPV